MSADANALIDYIRESVMHILGKPPTGPWAVTLRLCLDQQHHVLIPETAYRETQRNLSKDLMRRLKDQNVDTAMDTAVQLLDKYRSRMRPDNIQYVPQVQKMYARINADPTNQELVKWKYRKGRHVNNPVLGSDMNDIKILSTAVHHAQDCGAVFLTHDMDFTMFADDIHKTFGLRILDTHRLGR